MTRLFLDIETVPDFERDKYLQVTKMVEGCSSAKEFERKFGDQGLYWKFKKGSLVPLDGKVVLITYRIESSYIH